MPNRNPELKKTAPPKTESDPKDPMKEMIDGWQDLKNMDQPVSALGVTFEKRTFPSFDAEYAVISRNETQAELVFHLTFTSLVMMGELSEFLAKEIPLMGLDPSAIIHASRNPEYKNNWDLLIERLDKANAPYQRDRILQLLEIFSRPKSPSPNSASGSKTV